MIYLASPYTSPDIFVMEERYQRNLDMLAHLLAKGHVVYSPIVHFHPLACERDLPRDFAFWSRINLWMLGRADSLYVLKLDGWEESVGLTAEIERAKHLGIQTVYLKRRPEGG